MFIMSHLDTFTAEDVAELSDSSVDSQGDLIRIGNVPKEWYEKELHDGYDIDGTKVFIRGIGDNIDQFLLSKNKNELKRRIYDINNDKVMRINDRDLSIINRIRKGKCATKMYDVPIPETHVFDITTSGIRPKSHFIISKSNYKQILKNIVAIKKGSIKINNDGSIKNLSIKKKNNQIYDKIYDIWCKSNIKIQSRQILRAPKSRLPTNNESYNPSHEYLNDNNNNMKYIAFRNVPQYNKFINERFERCLDLYLLPRKISKKSIINSSNLLPLLPSIESLKPFPEILTLEYYGHNKSVTCIDISSDGLWIITGSFDGTIKIFEIDSGKEIYNYSFGNKNPIEFVQFNPYKNRQSLISVISKHRCFLIPISFITSTQNHQKYVINPIKKIKSLTSLTNENHNENHNHNDKMFVPQLNLKQTLNLLNNQNVITEIQQNTNDISKAVKWSFLTFYHEKIKKSTSNNVICLTFLNYLCRIKWHPKSGDYFLTFIENDNLKSSLIIHKFSKFESIIPFSKSIGEIFDVIWHPRKPLIYIACKKSIRCFNLKKCKLQEKYIIPSDNNKISNISRIDLHMSGLNLIVSTINGKVLWYDMDLSHLPYKIFNYHGNKCVRNIIFHKNNKYNHLWASCADDGKIYIFYSKMFRDKFADPILIPLKILQIKKHRFLDIKWHTTQPWIFAACSDGVTRLYTAL
eukprot:21100_1